MIMGRVAGAPISWGACEVPGWGYQLAAVGGFVPVVPPAKSPLTHRRRSPKGMTALHAAG
jgi:hypothetical protein